MLSKNIKNAGGFKNIKYRKYGPLMKTTYKSKKAPALTVKAVESIATKVVHNQIENKTACAITTAPRNVNAYVYNTLMGVVSCIPTDNISQSTGQSGRIANTIRTRYLNCKLVFFPNPFNATDNAVPKPQEVLLFFGKIKGQKSITPITADFQKLWQNGNSSVQPYSDLRDLTQLVNKDYWIVYKIFRFKIGFAAYGGTGSTAGQQFYESNDFKLNVVKNINLTKWCPKILKFNDTTLSPSNDNLFMWYEAVNADGSAASSTYPMSVSYTFNYFYEDG